MAITAVSGVKLTSGYNTAFQGRRVSQNVEHNESSGNTLRRVPVIVMLAMSPAMLNSEAAERYMPLDTEQLTEIVAQTPSKDISTLDIREVQAPQQADYPLGVAFLTRRKIQEIVPAVGNGVKANIVLTRYLRQGAEKDVFEIYYVEHSLQDENSDHEPPDIRELIYHNVGGENDFLGIKIYEPIYRADGTKNGMFHEVKLDDKSAQYLIDLLTGDTKWNNRTHIIYRETTNPRVMPPKVIN